MQRLKKADIILCAAVATVSAALFFGGILYRHHGTDSDRAGAEVCVWCDGEEIGRYPLGEDGEYRIDTSYGSNTLRIENGAVRMSEADCPGGDCLRMGALKEGDGRTIVCLPHRIIVRLVSDELDTVDVIVK